MHTTKEVTHALIGFQVGDRVRVKESKSEVWGNLVGTVEECFHEHPLLSQSPVLIKFPGLNTPVIFGPDELDLL